MITSHEPTFRSLSGLNECIGDDALVENECAPMSTTRKTPNSIRPDIQRARFRRCKWTRPQAQIVSNTGTSVHPYFEIEYRTQGGTVFS